QPVPQRVGGRHMDMAQRADDTFVDGHASSGTFEGSAGRAFDIAGLTNGRMNAELKLLGHGDLDLRGFAGRAEDPHALDAALGADNGELLLARVLSRLREVGMLCELV